MGRQVKKTVIKYQPTTNEKPVQSSQQSQNLKARQDGLGQERQRSRQKSQGIHEQSKKEVTVDVNSRKARLQAMRKARQQKQKQQAQGLKMQQQKHIESQVSGIKIVIVGGQGGRHDEQKVENQHQRVKSDNVDQQITLNQYKMPQTQFKRQVKLQQNPLKNNPEKPQNYSSSESQDQQQGPRVMHRPVFLSKQDRSQLNQPEQLQKHKQEQRRKKNIRYNTKILLEESLRKEQAEDSQQEIDNSDDEDETNLPDDSDDKNQQLEYELWKIRELKRIRRDRQLRQKHLLQKVQIQRRRQMNNEQILLQNRLLGSDSTDHDTQTKYVFMQKYYHKGAFYQDSSDPIFQRDYNLPTPMEMQDKSALPSVLQKRKGNFGKRGQSKYTHLTAEDTTDTNPLTRADESLLNSWKNKMAGYKK